jgi:hypothetical protein
MPRGRPRDRSTPGAGPASAAPPQPSLVVHRILTPGRRTSISVRTHAATSRRQRAEKLCNGSVTRCSSPPSLRCIRTVSAAAFFCVRCQSSGTSHRLPQGHPLLLPRGRGFRPLRAPRGRRQLDRPRLRDVSRIIHGLPPGSRFGAAAEGAAASSLAPFLAAGAAFAYASALAVDRASDSSRACIATAFAYDTPGLQPAFVCCR